MPDKLNDAEIIERLKLVKKHGRVEAAKFLGISARAMDLTLQDARKRELTAETKLKTDTVASLEAKLRVAERTVAAMQKHNLSVEEIRQKIYGLSELVPNPPSWIEKITAGRTTGTPVTIWSDFHWGEVVRLEEVAGVNEFNRDIAKQRFKRLVNTTVDLCINHMTKPKYPGIVICLGGDMITGTIHGELADTNDGYTQQCLMEMQDELCSAIEFMADKFGKVFVPSVVGNHGRETQKPRMKGRVYTNYEWNLYCQLERHFRSDKRVVLHVPGETDAYFRVYDHRFLLTHGDALGVKGGDGIIGAIGPIARGATKVGRSEAQIGRDFDTLLMGHYHTYIPRGHAAPVIVNGSLKGYDEYARLGLRVPYSRPSQALWFMHPDHGITAQWEVFLDGKRKAQHHSQWVSFLERKAA